MGWTKAADQVLDGLKTYISALEEKGFASEEEMVIWVNGYSRGGAVANLVGAALVRGGWSTSELDLIKTDIERGNVYTFCYECPQGTVSLLKKDGTYDNITNVVNPKDVVTKVAMNCSTWSFGRYGHDYVLPDQLNTNKKAYAGYEKEMYCQYDVDSKSQIPIIPENASIVTSALTNTIATALSRKDYGERCQNLAEFAMADGKTSINWLKSVMSATDYNEMEKKILKKK